VHFRFFQASPMPTSFAGLVVFNVGHPTAPNVPGQVCVRAHTLLFNAKPQSREDATGKKAFYSKEETNLESRAGLFAPMARLLTSVPANNPVLVFLCVSAPLRLCV